METNSENQLLQIGDIVSLKTHFYQSTSDSIYVVYSGEPKQISPLMVVTEMILEKNLKESESNSALSYRCKCIWFSHRTFSIEEAWVSSKFLRRLQEQEVQPTPAFGDYVEVKTAQLELSKRKSSLQQTDDTKSSTITADLNFVSPVMQVIALVENKKGQDDQAVTKGQKFIPKTLIKCNFYNPISDKLSEALIPLDALRIVDAVETTSFDIIREAILDKRNILAAFNVENGKKNKGREKESTVLLEPKRMNFRAGRYFLLAFNFFKSNIEEIELVLLTDLKVKMEWYSEELPRFKAKDGRPIVTLISKKSISELISRNKERRYWLVYKDFSDVETRRVIEKCEVVDGNEEFNDEIRQDTYLKAFCHLRQSERYFRIDRIISLKVLDFS